MSRPFPDPPATVPGLLERAADHFPQCGVAIFDGRGRSCERRTYPEVLASVRRGAGRWSALGVAPGDRVLVCLPTSWAWLEAWLGAVVRGALPVAVARGAALGAGEAHVRKIEGLVERLRPERLLLSAGLRRDLGRYGARRAAEVAITDEELAKVSPRAAGAPAPGPDPEEIVFLQLTSGSTGAVRAVSISHRAAVHNLISIHDAIGAPHGLASGWADAGVAWLPLHHDMGLIGCLFLPLYAGFDLWLFQPETFLARPRKWLEHIGRHRRVYTTAPNFGYQLCLERIPPEERQGIDLTPLKNAVTGAEMIRPETVDGFCAAFGPGFRRQAFRPSYGLAESTVAVTVGEPGLRTRPLPSGAEASGAAFGLSEVAAVGEPIPGLEVRVAGPGGRPLPDGEIGELWVRGPSVFSGYYNDPEGTAEVLRDGWLLTGDLGFRHRRELYITGRIKDLLIVRGTNIMPHEIEWVAEGVTGGGGALRSGAFSVARGAAGEEVVVVVEVDHRERDHLEDLGREIRQRIGRTLSLPVADLVFVRRGRIPKTTSGKVQRRELRDRYLGGELEKL